MIKYCVFAILFLFCTISADALKFTPQDMQVMDNEEWQNCGLDIPEVSKALAAYHKTCSFNYTLDEYFQDPTLYFKERDLALSGLISAVKSHMIFHPTLHKLQMQAANKKQYIAALPDMLTPDINKYFVTALSVNTTLPTTNLIGLHSTYWQETLDPLKRMSKESKLYLNRWKISSIPNYFIFLETIEYDPLLNLFAPQTTQITYLYEQSDRDPHQLHFKDGLAYLGQNLFHTADYCASRYGQNLAIFILGPDGHFYIHDQVDPSIHHSTEFAGERIISAGEISAENGRITHLNNSSGHYRPNADSLKETLCILRDKIGTLDTVEKVWYKTPDKQFEFAFDPNDFAKKGLGAIPKKESLSSPLHYAILHDIHEWLDCCKDAEEINRLHQGKTPLELAAALGKEKWIDLLLTHSAESTREGAELTPLEFAARSGDLASIKRLYEHTPSNKIRKAAVFQAAKSGSLEAFLFFKKKGVHLKSRDDLGNTILHYAASAPTPHVLKYLLEDLKLTKLVKVVNIRKESALHYAAAYGHPLNVTALETKGLSLMDKNFEGDTSLHLAAKHTNTAFFEKFIPLVAAKDWLSENQQGALPIHYAAANLSSALLMQLINEDTLNFQDRRGETPIFYTLPDKAHLNLCYLLDQGADASIRNTDGLTAIHKATILNSKNHLMLMTLLSYYDGLHDQTLAGETALDIAKRLEINCKIQYLLEAESRYLNKK